ncbi:MAG: transposase [Cyanobacteria bacterium]|nr:transposase [Cyanobacteriota bacterium]MDA1021074.1 transposase [Cyanobacteriota bacterium]
MPTIERYDYANSFHHVYSRGLDRFNIFHDDQDRYKFLACMEASCVKYGFRIHAYCLMDNHYHLYLQSIQGNLSKSLQSINSRYSIYYNLKYERSGTIFEGRFNSKLVQSEKYSLNLIRYIHCNPLKAGMVTDLDEYRWSSYPIYVGKQEPQGFFDCGLVIDSMSKQATTSNFRAFHKLDFDDDFDSKNICGDDEFIKSILESAIVKPYSESKINELIDEEVIPLFYEYIYSNINLTNNEKLRLYTFSLHQFTSMSYADIAFFVDADSPVAIKQMNYRFKKVHLESSKFASIYKDLLVIKDKVVNDVNTKRYVVTTRR